jgi:opacity protein-like surface antigen
MNIRKLLVVAVLALALIPAVASAQQMQQIQTGTVEDRTNQDAFVPFIGYNAGGALLDAISLAGSGTKKPRAYGASILFWGPGILAGELDFGYNPQFYENFTDVVASGSSSNLMTVTLNFVLGPTFFIGENMRVRPYALIGGGLMRSKIDEFIQHLSFSDTDNRGVIDIAGGVYFYPIKQIGVRGDVRFFRGVGANGSDKGYGLSDWSFYRITIGAAIAF